MRIGKGWALVLLLCAGTANACINEVGTDHQGNRFHADWPLGDGLAINLTRAPSDNFWLRDADAIVTRARSEPDFQTLTALGIVLIHQGKYTQAIRLFLALEKRYPGHHQTAANLGTALELAGHDATALRWIRLGIRRNADEHYGTEWLHARILEAKLAQAKDPTYLKRHSVAGVTFDKTLVPDVPRQLPFGNTGKPVTPRELDQALSYQLFERTTFVRSRDPVVASLLEDWATLNLAGGAIENAAVLYDAAVKYGAPRDALMRNRQEYIARVLRQAGDSEPKADAHCEICWRQE
ncbi:tetratricopeptide repeat protein [Agrilutibacter solisilvae]|uniref:Tetratricopeptide repeat protein n=1 Tax=Agrilutibacter solisilvae TaxID=2763317 RepID=A0A974Y1M6_9GAMM|nr:tetratricopeptide repeat protein [Lysobacter solisilvae]QSX78888.1 tetratricopeptide repeat protein [Lysobacter solisilvae]